MKAYQYRNLGLIAFSVIAVGSYAFIVVPYPRYRRAKDAAEFIEVGRKIVAYLDKHPDQTPSTVEEIVFAGALTDDDARFLKRHGIVYDSSAVHGGADAVLLSYRQTKGSSDRLVFDRSGHAYFLKNEHGR